MKEFLEPTAIAYQSPEHVETVSHSLQLNSAHSVLQGVWFNSVLYVQAGKLGYRKLKDGQWFGQWLFHERILGTSDTGSSIIQTWSGNKLFTPARFHYKVCGTPVYCTIYAASKVDVMEGTQHCLLWAKEYTLECDATGGLKSVNP